MNMGAVMPTRQALFALAMLAACTADPYGAAGGGSKPTPAPQQRSTSKPAFIPGNAEGDIPPVVSQHRASAKAEGAQLLVYVGASWCEPCQRFHEAVERGELDARLAGVQFVEYDADRDAERLTDAGYDGRLIPRFAMPGDDGRFGGTKIEGGTKGDGAVEHIMARLEPMLAVTAE
jgi:thiol-disulfide isomerase/thioredoxin